MIQINSNGYLRISKRAAKKAFEANKTIYLQRCNFMPVGIWSNCMPLNKETSYKTFEDNVFEFEYYNCVDTQTGKYASFYIKTN